MPARLSVIPAGLERVRAREAPAIGVGLGALRHDRWRRFSHGLYVPASASGVLEEARALADVLPRDSGLGHLTSASLRGWWLPLLPTVPPVLFGSTTSRVHVQRRGLYVRRSHYTRTECIDGVPAVVAEETLLELAQDLSLVDLVPMVDCALARGATSEALLSAARPRARGALNLRRAVALADPRSESWWESVLRLMHVIAGLGPVEAQVEIWDGVTFVGRADLHLVGTSRYPECDGGEHRTKERHGKDLRRDKAMHRVGADRYGYTTAEIARQADVIIRDAEDARALAHDPRRVTAWRRLAMGSTLTGHGRARLAARLARYARASNR